MKHLNLVISLWSMCLFLSVPACAFFDKDLHRLTMQDGLADNTVSCIHKDADGFMWFGTNNGLSRYDGKTIKNFSLSGEGYMNISSIVELSESYLGIVSEGILSVFDRKTERFIPLVVSGADKVHLFALLPGKNNTFWALSRKDLKLFRWKEMYDEKGRLQTISMDVDKEYKDLLPDNESYAAFCYSPDYKTLCLVSNRGNLIFFPPACPSSVQRVGLCNNKSLTVNSILNAGGFVWVSTTGEGLIRYHLRSGKVDRITYRGEGKGSLLSHTDVFEVIPLSNHRYLAATWSGYTILIPGKENPEELTTEIYNNTASQMYRNVETRMLSAYYDPQGVLWIGTNGGGVVYSDLRSQFFNQYHQERHNEICGIEMDSERHLWLATYHEGIMRSDEAFDPMKRLRFTTVGTEKVKSRTTVLCVVKDREHNLWFGNLDGTVTKYDQKTRQFTVYSLDSGGQRNTEAVWAIYMDRRNCFWIGTDNGLYRFYPSSGACEKVPVEAQLKIRQIYIRAVTATGDGSIWLGTSNAGACRLMEQPDGSVKVRNGYESRAKVESSSVRSLLGSSDGNLYVGYIDGFAVISPKTDSICEFYTTYEGLCSNFIGCIVEDARGRVWLGSNSGVSRYSRHQHLFYNYYIAGSNRSALFSNNMLFVGNNKSLTYFDPQDIEAYNANDKVYITDLEVNNRSIAIGAKMKGQTILAKGISYTDSVILSDGNRDFSLTFNNLSYSMEQQKYNYRLLPYQERWLVSNDGEKASYTNLPEGEYTFEVKNIYPDGHEGKVTSLRIKILPHWSRTWIFRSFVFIVFLGITAYLMRLVRIRQRRLEHEMQMKHELLTAHMEREKERQIRVERENFFTSAAHELRTPLTLILSPLQEMLQQTQPADPLYSRLFSMYKNGASLHTLVDHLLYVQKIEAGMVKLRLSEVNIVELIKEVSATFSEMAALKGFRFEVILPESPLWLWIDAEKIFSAIQNLLSNAFKYTSPGGSVSLSADRAVKDGKGYCRIVVSDTGAGIDGELKERIFDSFITGDGNPGFSTKVGIGLRIVKNTMDLHHGRIALDSTPGEGSVFMLSIPEGKEHFAGDAYEIVERRSVAAGYVEPALFPQMPESRAKPETGKRLLIIEDNPDMREYICSLFISRYVVLEAKDGEEGVRMAAANLPDLIISDVMMPVKDGFACCREIRANQETVHIPILMLTAKAEDADVLQGSRCGADDYMMKPFNPEILKAKVENLILQRERLKRIYTKALMLKQEPEEAGKENPFMQQVINIVEANISDENFSVKVLADRLNMSRPTLYRKLKQHSELAAVDIIRSIRVSKAASLIMENRYSIQEISDMVGFNDVRTLRKHFTEQFGVSPSRYMEGM